MGKFKNRHNGELNRMYDKLATLEPGTEEYAAVHDEILKVEESNEGSKDRNLKLLTFGVGLVAAPAIELLCKRNLTKLICKIEEVDILTSTPGKSISSWFRWK